MKINEELLRKIAHLSRLELNEKDIPSLLADMNAVVEWVEQLKEVDTKGVTPVTSMTLEVNALRADEVIPSLSQEEALLKAPEKNDDYFSVPPVMDPGA